MGLFRRLGRQVERFKSEAEAAAEGHSRYQCEACGARFGERHEQCPECASRSVISAEQSE